MRWLVLLSIAAAQTPTKLRMGSTIPYDSPWDEAADIYIKAVQELAGGAGQITFRKYFSGQLGGELEMCRSLRMGTLDIGLFSIGGMAEGFGMPELQVFEMPFLFSSEEEVDFVLDRLFPEIDRRLQQKGVVLLMWGANGWRHFASRERPILSPADLKGLKMRAQEAPVYIEMYKALGATPIPMPTPDVLIALKNKMVDGFDQTVVFAMSTGWLQQVRHFTLSYHVYQPGAIVMSKKVFDRLPPSLQKALRLEGRRIALQKRGLEMVRNEEKSILASAQKDPNVRFYQLSAEQRQAFVKAAQAAYPKIEAAIGPEGKALLAKIRAAQAEFRQQKAKPVPAK